MEQANRPSIKQIVHYHLTSSLVRIASFSEYVATKIYKQDHPQEEQIEIPDSLPCEAEAAEIEYPTDGNTIIHKQE